MYNSKALLSSSKDLYGTTILKSSKDTSSNSVIFWLKRNESVAIANNLLFVYFKDTPVKIGRFSFEDVA